MIGRFAGLALAASVTLASPALSQGVQSSPVLTLDQDRMYSASLFGKRVQAELQDASRALSLENRKIESALEEEELRLTEDRPDMEASAFQVLATDFDERVRGIRSAQSKKSDSIRRSADAERARFFEAAFPILLELVEETGAVAILNNSAVIFSIRQIDITNAAIERIDAQIGPAPGPVDTGKLPTQRPDAPRGEAVVPADDAPADAKN